MKNITYTLLLLGFLSCGDDSSSDYTTDTPTQEIDFFEIHNGKFAEFSITESENQLSTGLTTNVVVQVIKSNNSSQLQFQNSNDFECYSYTDSSTSNTVIDGDQFTIISNTENSVTLEYPDSSTISMTISNNSFDVVYTDGETGNQINIDGNITTNTDLCSNFNIAGGLDAELSALDNFWVNNDIYSGEYLFFGVGDSHYKAINFSKDLDNNLVINFQSEDDDGYCEHSEIVENDDFNVLFVNENVIYFEEPIFDLIRRVVKVDDNTHRFDWYSTDWQEMPISFNITKQAPSFDLCD